MSISRTVVHSTRLVLTWLVIVVCVGVVAVAVVVPRIGGATPYSVLTGSMRPDYPPGTLVVVRPVPADELQVGDVVTVQLTSGRSGFVTHRIVDVVTSLDGTRRFRTQGDANDVADAELRLPEQIRGRLWYAVPYLGRANTAIDGQQRQVAVYAVAGALLVYAGAMLTGSVLDRRRRRATSSDPSHRDTAESPR